VLSGSIAAERFEPVPRWQPQIEQSPRNLELTQLSASDPLDGHEPPHTVAARKASRLATAKRPNHADALDSNATRAARNA